MPAHGRAGWAAIAIAMLVVAMPAGLADTSEAKRKRCKASEVKRTVSYRKGGRKHRAKGCAPRTGTVPATVAAALPTVLKRTRALAAKLAPRVAKRARKRKAARRVARADRATDAALGRSAAPLAIAATVESGSDRSTVPGPPGTRSSQTRSLTEWSGNEPRIGRDGALTTDTRSTRIAGGGSSRHKSIKFRYLMDRCPDGGGIGRAPVTFSKVDRWTIQQPGGTVVQTERAEFEGEIVAHFGDDARIASVDVTGTWSWSTETSRGGDRVARHAVGGGAHSEGFSQSTSGGSVGNHVEVRSTVSTATDDGTAISGNYLGLFTVVLPDIFMEEALDGIQKRALSGACVRVVPNESTVHVSPARSAPVVAHLVDSTGTTFAGAISTTNARVSPPRADGNPDAQFTYVAPANASGTDFVRLEHTSRRGKANPGIVNIVIDSFDYRVLSASLNESVTAERPPDFAQCPANGSQTNTMGLGPQPYDPSTSSDGHLFADGPNLSGQIRASGTVSLSSNVTGCDVGSTPTPCSGTGSAEEERAITVQVDLPKAGGPATVQWFFNQDPVAGIGNEFHGSCLTYFFHARTENQSLGVRSVPRSVFETSGPSTLSIEVQLDLPGDQGGMVHATERYSLTIQRVTG